MEGALGYAVEKSVPEQRYTYGPLYAPDRLDAHKEWVDADTLQKAIWDYVRASSKTGRRINLQHGDFGDRTVGEWVEVATIPFEHTVRMIVPGVEKAVRKVTFPPGTVWLGIVWDEDVWPLVKAGKLGGLSMGGRAVRAASDGGKLTNMGWKIKKLRERTFKNSQTEDAYDRVAAAFVALRRAEPPQLTGGADEIPQGAGDDDPPPPPATGRQSTGAGDGAQHGMPRHQRRNERGRFHRGLITHRGASLFR
jgi:hypothetical protein